MRTVRFRRRQLPAAVALAAFLRSLFPGSAHADPLPSAPADLQAGPTTLNLPDSSGDTRADLVSVDPSTGRLAAALPLSRPRARGPVQVDLALSYSAGSFGVGGPGWRLNIPAIERTTPSGAPRFADPPQGGTIDPATQDQFTFGGQPLVPICLVGSNIQSCIVKGSSELMPEWAAGWLYYRLEHETSELQRFFWSPDHTTWVVQRRDGTALELGIPQDDPADQNGVDRDQHTHGIFRWNLVRGYDTQVKRNQTVLVWSQRVAGEGAPLGFLTDVYDTPASAPNRPPRLDDYAHHAALVYDSPLGGPTVRDHRTRVWRALPYLVLTRVDVTSKPFLGQGAREQVARYFLSYERNGQTFHLAQLLTEGACPSEVRSEPLPEPGTVTACIQRAPITLRYSTAELRATSTLIGATLPHYFGQIPTLIDVNSDGLPDIISTPGGGPNPTAQNVSFNSIDGPNVWTPGTLSIIAPKLGIGPTVMNPSFPAYNTGDFVGDGRMNVLWMGPFGTGTGTNTVDYATYSPVAVGNQATWNLQTQGSFTLDQQCNPPVTGEPFTGARGGCELKYATADIDGDHLGDLITSYVWAYFDGHGNQYHQEHQLDVRFTTRDHDGTIHPFSTAVANTGWPTWCVGGANSEASLFDKDHPATLADVNGDGLADWVKLGPDVGVWLGHGDGVFGHCVDGSASCSCDGAYREPWSSSDPSYSADFAHSHLHDVTGDGRADLVVVTDGGVDVFPNNGKGFDSKVSVPLADSVGWSYSSGLNSLKNGAILFADMNGNGVEDIVIENGGGGLAYVDMQGARPNVLTDIDNGDGLLTHVDYANTIDMARQSRLDGVPWTAQSPQIVDAVVGITRADSVAQYRTQYRYVNAAFDPRSRRFLGFELVQTTTDGDKEEAPTVTLTRYYQGRCGSSSPCTGSTDDSLSALRGLPILTEVMGTTPASFLSTTHHTFGVAPLQTSLDGRQVRRVFREYEDRWLYDPAQPATGPTTVAVPDIDWGGLPSAPVVVHSSAGTQHLRTATVLDPLLGVERGTIDYGLVDNSFTPQADVLQHGVTIRPIATDTREHWIWRLLDEVTIGTLGNGQQPIAAPRHIKYDYDAAGNLLKVWGELSGTLPLDRAAGGAPAPAQASADGMILLEQRVPDDYGNSHRFMGASGRCFEVDYDDAFHQLPTTTRRFVNGCDSPSPVVSMQTWDRGLGVVRLQRAADGAAWLSDYDGFGRLLSIAKPNPVTGAPASSQPALTIEYPRAGGRQLVHASTTDGNKTMERWSYLDGFGRRLLSVQRADPSAGDAGAFVVSGEYRRSRKGSITRYYAPHFYDGDPTAVPVGAPTGPSTVTHFDSFGRIQKQEDIDGTPILSRTYHALSYDERDAEQLKSGGTHAASYRTLQRDGHGRLQRFDENVNGGLRSTRLTFLPTGEVSAVARGGTDANGTMATYRRWIQYDSFGRMVQNGEPNSAVGLDPNGPTAGLKSWRYAYDDAGDLVGTSDARGCGENRSYDGLGRLVSEDYSPCATGSQPPYSAPSADGTGTEVFYQYDTIGHLREVFDRASHTVYHYDGRGRISDVQRQLAKPGNPAPALADRYTSHWFRVEPHYDDLDRVASQSTGADVPELLGAAGTSNVTATFSARGLMTGLQSSYGALVENMTYAADGQLTSQQLGDAAHTLVEREYDSRRRLHRMYTHRTPGPWLTAPGYTPPPLSASALQTVLQDTTLVLDDVGNPTNILDQRLASEWPAGARPASQSMVYDDLYRAISVKTTYGLPGGGQGDDVYADPLEGVSLPYPRTSLANRPRTQSFNYDGQGNLVSSDDDAHAFYDRSLGTVTYKNQQLQSASNDHGVTNGASAFYDNAGNVYFFQLRKPGCGNGCSTYFFYDWDEVGRLTHAKGQNAGGTFVDVTYGYEANGRRLLRAIKEGTAPPVYTAEIFPTLRLTRAAWLPEASATGEYDRSGESAALGIGGALVGRVLSLANAPGPTSGGQLHVLLEVPDQLGSLALAIDRATGELVERATYQPYGAADSDLRQTRWGSFREDFTFDGNEDDREVGLRYFNARFYSPALGRFLSPDPATIHDLASDLNPYAFVEGRVFRASDPSGLGLFDIFDFIFGSSTATQGSVGTVWGAGDELGARNLEQMENTVTKAAEGEPVDFTGQFKSSAGPTTGPVVTPRSVVVGPTGGGESLLEGGSMGWEGPGAGGGMMPPNLLAAPNGKAIINVAELIFRKGIRLAERLEYEEALKYIRLKGGDVIVKTRTEAYELARQVSGGREPIHDIDQFGQHFHPVDPVTGNKIESHIYYGEGNKRLYSSNGLPLYLDMNGDGSVDWRDFFDIFTPWVPRSTVDPKWFTPRTDY